jgi:lactoylglutathione lyase
MRLDGFGIFVKDMVTMVRFYKDVLNFEIREDENASNVYLVKDGTLFLLYRRTDFENISKLKEIRILKRIGTDIKGHWEIVNNTNKEDE